MYYAIIVNPSPSRAQAESLCVPSAPLAMFRESCSASGTSDWDADRATSRGGADRHSRGLSSQGLQEWSHAVYALKHGVTRWKPEKPLCFHLEALTGRGQDRWAITALQRQGHALHFPLPSLGSVRSPPAFVPSIPHTPSPANSLFVTWGATHTASAPSASPQHSPSSCLLFYFPKRRRSLRTQGKHLGKFTFLPSSALSREQMREGLSVLHKQQVAREIICFQRNL